MFQRRLLCKCALLLPLSLVSAMVASTNAIAVSQNYGPTHTLKVPVPMLDSLYKNSSDAPQRIAQDIFDIQADVSQAFQIEIEQAMHKLPINCVEALESRGYKIVLSRTVTDAVPAAKNQQVRGYEPSATWNSVYGMFNRSTKRVVMAEKAEPQGGKHGLVPLEDKQRRQGILRHEFGHAVDHYLGNYSHSAEFVAAYKKGVESIKRKADKETLAYFLQHGYAGLEETFAEVFACMDGDACDKQSDVLLRTHFPEAMRLVRNKIVTIHRSEAA